MKRPSKMTALAAVRGWLQHSEAGSRILYHTGDLAVDRERDSDLDTRATLLYRASETYGTVALTQKRLGPHNYQYIATRRHN